MADSCEEYVHTTNRWCDPAALRMTPGSLAERRRLAVILCLAALLATVTGCGWGDRVPAADAGTLSVTDVSETGFTVRWRAARNEPVLGGFVYDVYAASTVIETVADLDGIEPVAFGPGRVFGDDTLSYRVDGLPTGTSHYVTVAVSPRDRSSTVLYNGLVATTKGTTVVTTGLSGIRSYEHLPLQTSTLARTYTLQVDVGGGPTDLYLIFTNPTQEAVYAPFVGSLSSIEGRTGQAPEPRSILPEAGRPTGERVVLPDRPIVEATQDELRPSRAAARSIPPPSRAISDAVGAPGTFYDYDGGLVEIPATVRAVVEDDPLMPSQTLSIWVADDSWEVGGTKMHLVTQPMVDHLANAFLKDDFSDDSDDIYSRVTAVYGEVWGPRPDGFENLIPPDQDHITILLYDIGGNTDPAKGGVVGYFWPKDNYFRTSTHPILNSSNERVMFYLNSVLYAAPDGSGPWSPDHFWPQEVVSAAAHELQHAINFYQRDVLLETPTPTWLNEMLSLVAEDLVADTTGVRGPRGVSHDDATAGAPNNTHGRFPDYNVATYGSLTAWGGAGHVLNSYGLAYSFGAFLTRNYGGAAVAGSLVQNPHADVNDALAYAISDAGGPVGMGLPALLWRWGVSVLLSDATGAPVGVQLNDGTWFDASLTNGTPYKLGSINAYNFQRAGGSGATGPFVFTADSPPAGSLAAASNQLYRHGPVSGAMVELTVSLPRDAQLTLVAK